MGSACRFPAGPLQVPLAHGSDRNPAPPSLVVRSQASLDLLVAQFPNCKIGMRTAPAPVHCCEDSVQPLTASSEPEPSAVRTVSLYDVACPCPPWCHSRWVTGFPEAVLPALLCSPLCHPSSCRSRTELSPEREDPLPHPPAPQFTVWLQGPTLPLSWQNGQLPPGSRSLAAEGARLWLR